MSFTFDKKDRLKSEKLITKLFSDGKSITLFPLRLIFLKTEFDDNERVKASVSVSKRNFKKAVDRNRVKRLLREGYRLNKSHFFNNTDGQFALMILYLGKEMPDYHLINSKLKLLFSKFSAIVAEDKK